MVMYTVEIHNESCQFQCQFACVTAAPFLCKQIDMTIYYFFECIFKSLTSIGMITVLIGCLEQRWSSSKEVKWIPWLLVMILLFCPYFLCVFLPLFRFSSTVAGRPLENLVTPVQTIVKTANGQLTKSCLNIRFSIGRGYLIALTGYLHAYLQQLTLFCMWYIWLEFSSDC